MNNLLRLSQELLEKVFIYVNVEDLLTVWTVVEFEGSEYFYRVLCEREGYKNNLTEGNSWKSLFYSNVNWMTQKFIKREYTFDVSVNKIHKVRQVLLGKNLVIQNADCELSVWNVDTPLALVDTFEGEILEQGRGKILLCNKEDNLKIYTFNNFYDLQKFNKRDLIDYHYALTDEYFVMVPRFCSHIYVFNIDTGNHYKVENIPPSDKKPSPMSIKILGIILCIIVSLEEGHFYDIKIYNLEKREWLNDSSLCLKEGGPFDTEHLTWGHFLASWSYNIQCSNDLTVRQTSDPDTLKVWNSNYEFLKTLSEEFVLSVIRQVEEPYEISWFIVKDKHIIFSISYSTILIWCSDDPDTCKYLNLTEDDYLGQDVISSNILVLSYESCFKVIDFKKATYLYEILFNISEPDKGLEHHYQEYCVNEFFYMHINYVYKPQNEAGSSKSEGEHCDQNCRILTLYDFRSQQ